MKWALPATLYCAISMSNPSYLYESDTTNPYANIAREEQLLLGVPLDAVILYLWQNERTVVIGRNQCAWSECNVQSLKEDNGFLARRLSGGGAVFHDLGNLNFTFLYPKKSEDIARQTRVIAGAVASFGLRPEISGRNDITVDGKKFSGNAYYTQGNRAYHHGTLMLDVNPAALTKYLNVHQEKYRSKGVDSVRARVVNLQELCSDITVRTMKDALIKAFETEYQCPVADMPTSWMQEAEMETRRERFSGWDWVYGRPVQCSWSGETRFPWGTLRVELDVDKGIIRDLGIFTDALEVNVYQEMEQKLKGQRFDKNALTEAILKGMEQNQYADGLQSLLESAF
jgi:lipoate-protein ligase A